MLQPISSIFQPFEKKPFFLIFTTALKLCQLLTPSFQYKMMKQDKFCNLSNKKYGQ